MQIIIDVIKQILRGILLAEKQKMRTFAMCFHSIRFKVNKGWSSAELLFLCPYFPSPQNALAFVLKRKDISTKT